MTKQELRNKLGIDEDTLNSVIKSCAYTEIKNFSAIHESVIRSFLKRTSISYAEDKNISVKSENKNHAICERKEKQVVSDIIENIEVVTVVRKELIELISRAYHKGIEAGKNSIFIADKNKLEQIFEEALSK